MSSYFDKLARQVSDLSRECPHSREGTETFLKGLIEIEKSLIRTCELFAGDIETPQDVREAIITCICNNQVRYDGGDTLRESRAAMFADACRSSMLVDHMHSLWHDIARMRYTMRYGLVSDNPEWAVNRRDAFAEERKGRHPWQKKAPTAGTEPLRFSDYRPPTKVSQ